MQLRPHFPVALSNLGNALRTLGDIVGAEPPLREAVRLMPTSPEARNNLGVLLVQTARWDEAIAEYHAAIAARPDYAEAHLNLALAYLACGDYERGWQEYEWRGKTRSARPPQIDAPRWDGTPRPGGTILICAEQGLGDTIHFVRYAALVRQRCQTVVLDCQQPVEALVRSCPGVDQIRQGPPPQPDAWVPMMSLPGLLGMPPTAALPPVPYLQPPAERIAYWRDELAAIPGCKVGIAWQGSPFHKGDRLRSVPLERFAPLAALPGIQLISLQKSPGIEQLTERAGSEWNILNLGARTGRGLEDAAAVMVHLDLLILVDTALAHAAGALGIPVWVAVPYAADWRWGREDATTIWYPTMRLFRQPHPGDWEPVFARITVELAAWSTATTPPTGIGPRSPVADENREPDGCAS